MKNKKDKTLAIIDYANIKSWLREKKTNVSVSMELLVEILPELVFLKMQKPVDKRRVFKKCTLSIATLNRLSSLFYKTGDKKRGALGS